MQQTLQPGDQMWVDVGKLIREHVPDINGKLLPATVTSGNYEIRDLTNKAIGTLFEGKVVFDKTYGKRHLRLRRLLLLGAHLVLTLLRPLGHSRRRRRPARRRRF